MSLDAAIAELAASRQRLRGVMIPPPREPMPSLHGQGLWQQGRVLWRYMRQTGRRNPVLRLAAEALQGWWMAHPLRQLAQTAMLPIQDAATPVVKRHPWAAVALAAAGGAALAVARPWRWTVVRQQARLLRRQAMGWALALAGGPMGQAVIASLLASAATMSSKTAPEAAAESGDAEASPDPVAWQDEAGLEPLR